MAGLFDVAASIASNLTEKVKDFAVKLRDTDGADDSGSNWFNDKWRLYFSQYKEIPEYNTAVNAKARWVVGRGYTADETTTMILDSWKGYGFDTFIKILENMIRTNQIGGDAHSEIIRDEEGNPINLKPLNPGRIEHVFGADGILKRFEQRSTVEGKPNKKFRLDQIFYLPRNRIADEVHGTSVTEKLQFIINARNEAMNDYKQVMHFFVKPRWMIKLDTDKPDKIAAEKEKWDNANGKGENMYIPMGAVEAELMAVSGNASMSPLTWIEALNDYFYEACEVPKIIVGNSKNFTDAASKISYLTYEQNVREEQLYIEEQVLAQLNFVIKLNEPASLENDLISSAKKEGDLTATQPNDTTTELEGRT